MKNLMLLAAVNLICSFSSCAQTKNDRLDELVLVYYRTNDSTKKLSVIMDNYIKITGDGLCHDMSNAFNGINFSGYRKDTTFKISDSLLTVLNDFFVNRRKLSSHVKTDNLNGGSNAAPYQFIYYRSSNKADSSISIISNNDAELTAIFTAIWHLPFPRTTYTGKIYHDKALENRILAYHKKIKPLPDIVKPPTVKNMPASY